MKKIKTIIIILFILGLAGLATLLGLDYYVRSSTSDFILDLEASSTLEDVDYILILGAGLNSDGTPSPMLKERLDAGIELYKEGVSDKILVSGDHLEADHDEVNSMKNYMTKEGIPSDAIYMDHAGISTYDSFYRAKEMFSAHSVIAVTQKYHLYRSIYIGKSLGLAVHGYDATRKTYSGQLYRDAREILARVKDFVKCLAKPTSSYLGEAIPVSAGGNATNDREYLIIEGTDSSEIYLSDANCLERIKTILADCDFIDKRSNRADYTFQFQSGEKYTIEIDDDKIYIATEEWKATLNEEDTSFFQLILGLD